MKNLKYLLITALFLLCNSAYAQYRLDIKKKTDEKTYSHKLKSEDAIKWTEKEMIVWDASDYYYTYLLSEVESVTWFKYPTGPSDGSNTANGYEWVELGLSSGTKWATMNVGATKPEEAGNYYQWGDPEAMTIPGLTSHYRWRGHNPITNSTIFTKYITRNINAAVLDGHTTLDGRRQLDLIDDMANVNWGDEWRVPTFEEWRELQLDATWNFTTLNGTNVYEVTGPNGNKIYLPFASFNMNQYVGDGAYYWSSSLASSDDSMAGSFNPQVAGGLGVILATISPRLNAFSVRPVYGNYKNVTPRVAITDIVNVGAMSARALVIVNPDRRVCTISEYGVCYNKTGELPTLSDEVEKSTEPLDGALGIIDVTGLEPHETYVARAYAVINGSVEYAPDTYVINLSQNLSVVNTGGAYVESDTSVKLTASLETGNLKYKSIEFGICYATHQEPTTEDQKVVLTPAKELQETVLTDLEANGTYYYRAYAIVDGKLTVYGEEQSFTLAEKYEAEQMVDLELPSGNMWASCNVGASYPEDQGEYFCWGEVEPKESGFTKENYRYWSSEFSDYTKYKETRGSYTMHYEDDPAYNYYGDGWRTPTSADYRELRENCEMKWTIQNGRPGVKATSKHNGKSIFLPATGYKTNKQVDGVWTDLLSQENEFVVNWTRECSNHNGGTFEYQDDRTASFAVTVYSAVPVRAIYNPALAPAVHVESITPRKPRYERKFTKESGWMDGVMYVRLSGPNGETPTINNVIWESSDESVCRVRALEDYYLTNSNPKEVYCSLNILSMGKATITATSFDGKHQTTFLVNSHNGSVEGIEMKEEVIELRAGSRQQLGFNLIPADADNRGVTFTSSDNFVAYVSGETLYAQSEGICTIYAKTNDGGHIATVKVTVLPKE